MGEDGTGDGGGLLFKYSGMDTMNEKLEVCVTWLANAIVKYILITREDIEVLIASKRSG